MAKLVQPADFCPSQFHDFEDLTRKAAAQTVPLRWARFLELGPPRKLEALARVGGITSLQLALAEKRVNLF